METKFYPRSKAPELPTIPESTSYQQSFDPVFSKLTQQPINTMRRIESSRSIDLVNIVEASASLASMKCQKGWFRWP